MKPIIPYLISTLIVYFFFVFITWQYNPSQWVMETRVIFILICILTLLITEVTQSIDKIN
jgi:hypothetical protein